MLVEKLKSTTIDVVGDVHGEFDALMSLLSALGYSADGVHPEGRMLVFVGDLVDRGPRSPDVLEYVMKLVLAGNAQMVVGNHELNFLKSDYHEGTGWSFWNHCPKEKKFEPYQVATDAQKKKFRDFLNNCPLILESDTVCIAHAVYSEEDAESLKSCPVQTVFEAFQFFQLERERNPEYQAAAGLAEAWLDTIDETDDGIQVSPPDGVSHYYELKQKLNPVTTVLTGVEVAAPQPFYIGGKWRFVQRHPWWNTTTCDKKIVIGHYWRRVTSERMGPENLFKDVSAYGWMGPAKNVFCVDYSVGRRYQDRSQGLGAGQYRTLLSALRLPENKVYNELGGQFECD